MYWSLRCTSYRTNSSVRTLNAVFGNNLSVLRSIQNTDALCGQDVGFLNGKADGTSSNHWARCEVVRRYIDIKDKDGSDGLLVIDRYYTMHWFRQEYREGAQLMLLRRASLRLKSLSLILEGVIISAFCRVTSFIVLLTTFLGIVLFGAQVFTCFINFTEVTLSTFPCSVLLVQVSRTICRQV